jgi:hypothetical protein
MRKLLLLVFLVLPVIVEAQTLLPSIGISSLPANNTSICPFTVYTGDYDASGFQPGATVPDFTFYTIQNNPANLLQELQDQKPILLVSGSYTCPAFRNKVQALNNIYNTYQNQIKVFVVYTLEAHPNNSASPYSGILWVTSQNQQEGILYGQPQTYGQRRNIANTMVNNLQLLAPVIIDGPCNEWWNAYGPAPNNAYLINTQGEVFVKHDWFQKAPKNMFCDIDSLLQNPCGSTPPPLGSFTFNYTDNNTSQGIPGDVILVYGELVNNTDWPVDIEFERVQNNIPIDWESSLCADVCLPSWVNTGEIYIPAGGTQPFAMYFYTSSMPQSGQTRVRFTNKNDANNEFLADFFCTTEDEETGIIQPEEQPLEFILWPNPARDVVYIQFKDLSAPVSISIFSATGKAVFKSDFLNKDSNGRVKISLSKNDIGNGIYFITVAEGQKLRTKKLVVADN